MLLDKISPDALPILTRVPEKWHSVWLSCGLYDPIIVERGMV